MKHTHTTQICDQHRPERSDPPSVLQATENRCGQRNPTRPWMVLMGITALFFSTIHLFAAAVSTTQELTQQATVIRGLAKEALTAAGTVGEGEQTKQKATALNNAINALNVKIQEVQRTIDGLGQEKGNQGEQLHKWKALWELLVQKVGEANTETEKIQHGFLGDAQNVGLTAKKLLAGMHTAVSNANPGVGVKGWTNKKDATSLQTSCNATNIHMGAIQAAAAELGAAAKQ